MHTVRDIVWFKRVGLLAMAILIAFFPTAPALDFPRFSRLSNWLNLSENAADEVKEEDRISEVLNQDSSYRSLFDSFSNPDIPLHTLVRPGEELRYQAKWRGLPAGSIRLSAKRVAMLKNRPVFVFELSVESNDFLSAFYPVQTNINSYVDADNGRSYLVRRRVSERNREYKDRLEFKYDFRMDNGLPDPVSKYSVVDESGKEQSNRPFPIPGNMQDVVSIIYYIRGMELNRVGDCCSLLLGGRKKPVLTEIRVVGEEEVAVPGIGVFDCLVVEPRTDGTHISGNMIATRGGERVWLEKNSLIPVMVSAELPKPLGTVTAILTQADNCTLARHAKK